MPDGAAYIRSIREIKRENELGFIAFDCPICADERGRGWLHVDSLAVGCFNGGCEANPRLAGGVAELARRVEGLADARAGWAWLSESFPGGPTLRRQREKDNWCNLPPCSDNWAARVAAPYVAFVKRQWGLSIEDLRIFDVRFCQKGYYAGRLIVPVHDARGHLSGFVARAIAPEAPKRYLASQEGVDCGRSVGDLLFGLDRVQPGERVIMVEGCGDVMNLNRRGARSVGALGSSVSSLSVASLIARRPGEVVVALDADAMKVTSRIAAGIKAWGVPVRIGRWHGAKDAGAGAKLKTSDATIGGLLRARLGG